MSNNPDLALRRAQLLLAEEEAGHRVLTRGDREEIEHLLAIADQGLGRKSRQPNLPPAIGDLSAGAWSSTAGDGSGYARFATTPGEMFTASAGYKSIRDSSRRGESWSSGLVEVAPAPALALKGTVTEGLGAPGSGTAGGLMPVLQVVPGVVGQLFQRLSVESVLGAAVADGSTVRFAYEGTATSAAAGVAEGGTKPESSLGVGTKDEPIKKIATFVPISDELLEDAPAIQSYINSRLSMFISIEVERQLLRGTSGGNEVQGLLTSRGVPVFTGGTADSKAVQMFKSLNSMRGSAYLEPEWILMSPTDYQVIRLLTDSAGQFFGGGPFSTSYGGGAPGAPASSQVTGVADSLWGKPLYVTSALGAGTALIGTTAGASVY